MQVFFDLDLTGARRIRPLKSARTIAYTPPVGRKGPNHRNAVVGGP
jgi:hypothetical protein